MPPKKSNIGRKSLKAQQAQHQREQETQETKRARLEANRERAADLRSQQTPEQTELRREDDRTRQAAHRAVKTGAERDRRLEAMRAKVSVSAIPRVATWVNEAYHYQPEKDYHLHKEVQIGTTSNGKPCSYCGAKKLLFV